MLLSKFAEVRCETANKKHFNNLEYEWKKGDIISVPIEHLMEKSTARVVVICDYCLAEGKTKFFNKTLWQLKLSRKSIAKDACETCIQKRREEVLMLKHGVKFTSQIKLLKQGKFSSLVEFVASEFEKQNYTLHTQNLIYENDDQPLSFTCSIHPELGLQQTTYRNVKRSKTCKSCIKEHQSGSNSSFWKGGVSPLNHYLRNFIELWKSDSKKACDYKCIITGDKKDWIIHHLYPFNKILDETFQELGFPMHDDVSIYSDTELSLIKEKILEIHYRYPLGVLVREDIHDAFHSSFREDFTPEDFFNYVKEIYGMNYEPVYGQYVKVKYMPFKKNSTSKFNGVSKQYGKWHVIIKRGRKTIKLGPFGNEIEAALSYNEKIIELRGPDTPINFISEEELKSYEEFQKVKEKMVNEFYLNSNSEKEYRNFHPLKTEGSSRFIGVFKVKKYWVSRIVYKREKHKIGHFKHEVEAALAYNIKAIELFGEEAQLNFISKDEYLKHQRQLAEHRWEYFEPRKNASTIYTNVMFDKYVWVAIISINNKNKNIGYYITDKLAAIAYNHYVIKNDLPRKLNKIDGIEPEEYEKILNEYEEEKKYFKCKSNGPTIYTNVKLTNTGRWQASIHIEGKFRVINRYDTDWEAAIAYNAYVKYHKLDRQLNKIVGIPEETIQEYESRFEDDQKYHRHKTDGPTIYTNVTLEPSRRWSARIKRTQIGTYDTDWEAAIACNEYIKYHKLVSKLNKIVGIDESTIREHAQRFEEDQKYFRHKTTGTTIYTNVRKSNQKWAAFISTNGKVHLIGLFTTANKAAQAYNEYVIENKLERKLNKIV
ncbi:hypothetical protein V8V54_26455 [Priestia megaterium]|uniref:hypothetical protein n=1 Tax=Priestia megaterium TaxID=1404 RepID=UPI003009F516